MEILTNATALGMVDRAWKQDVLVPDQKLFEPTSSARPIDDLRSAKAQAPNADTRVDESYDPEAAYLMSVIAAWAYSDEAALGTMLRHYGMKNASIRRITVQNNALLVVTTAYLIQSESGKSAVLAFRGTDPADFIALLTDAQVMQRTFLEARVHSGFLASTSVVWDGLNGALDRMLSKEDRDIAGSSKKEALTSLYITGHSLGGAMAVLAAARFFAGPGYNTLNPLIKGVYTFGQPIVGDSKFAADCATHFGSRLYRHVYGNDVVPHLPPKFINANVIYEHPGGEWRSGGLLEPWKYTQNPARRLGGLFLGPRLLFNALKNRDVFAAFMAHAPEGGGMGGVSIDDHSPANYLHVSALSMG